MCDVLQTKYFPRAEYTFRDYIDELFYIRYYSQAGTGRLTVIKVPYSPPDRSTCRRRSILVRSSAVVYLQNSTQDLCQNHDHFTRRNG